MTTETRSGYSTFGRAFWRAAIDRAVKTGAQAVIGIWTIGDGLLNAWEVDPKQAVGLFVGGVVLSLITSVASAPIGPVDSPSTI
jgi:hypothetical protein